MRIATALHHRRTKHAGAPGLQWPGNAAAARVAPTCGPRSAARVSPWPGSVAGRANSFSEVRGIACGVAAMRYLVRGGGRTLWGSSLAKVLGFANRAPAETHTRPVLEFTTS